MSRRVRFDPQRRASRIPELSFPDQLPVSQRRDDIAAAIRDHQVVVVAGDTGSGKTTQLPKIALSVGRGLRGVIGHTQPRRIAARAVAERIAEETGTKLGDDSGVVAYKVRFTEQGGRDPLVKVMTDGILLAEIQSDPMLRRYDTLILDEAHERSLTIDFLLGYLHQLLPQRPDLKVIITSATIDPARFAAFFARDGRTVPVLEVTGRTYPVEVRYRPPADDVDPVEAITTALTELAQEPPGDVLVFLSGEREIRDTSDAVRRLVDSTPRMRGTEVVPLYGRLSAAEQHKVFEAHRAPRIVLATNVAETSLTVPGIRYVVDPGTARVSRFSSRLKVQRLPIEPISQASARQRAGRCGRVADGICIRLYGEEDFAARPEFTDPEILRTSLASVILRMAALRLGDIASFGFLDPPDPRAVRDGVALLRELGALGGADGAELTAAGRRMARLPVDPRWARVIVEADGADELDDAIVVAAALSIQDPRETPGERGSAEHTRARAHHARFADPTSDFVAWLRLWDHVRAEQRDRSSTSFRRMCRDENLHYLRIREWQDLVAQLHSLCREIGIGPGPHRRPDVAPERSPERLRGLHRCLITGMLAHIGLRTADRKDYLGARGARWAIWPGSGLFAAPPTWAMAGELVETSRLWGRDCARVDPADVERAAEHLVVRSHSEPRWSRNRGSAVATERVTLYGVPLVTDRVVPLGPIDSATARDLFVRHALVEGEWRIPSRSPLFAFWRANRELHDELRRREDRTRTRGIVVDDDDLVELYLERIPDQVVSQAHFERWWRREHRSRPHLLTFAEDELVAEPTAVDDEAYPVLWSSGEAHATLDYRYAPGDDDDGVTATVTLADLASAGPAAFESLVPGYRLDLATALIRSLPKPLRRRFAPAPDAARAALAIVDADAADADSRPGFADALARALRRVHGGDVTADDFDWSKVPVHLRPLIRVVDLAGTTITEGRDAAAVLASVRGRLDAEIATSATDVTAVGLSAWPAGGVPRSHSAQVAGASLTSYPALVDRGDVVDVVAFADPRRQLEEHRRGVARLIVASSPSPVRAVVAASNATQRLLLARGPRDDVPELLADLVDEVAAGLLGDDDDLPWTDAAFERSRDAVRSRLHDAVAASVAAVARAHAISADVENVLGRPAPDALSEAHHDIGEQYAALMHAGYLRSMGYPQVLELPRYLTAIVERWQRIGSRRDRDRVDMLMVRQLQDDWLRCARGPGLAQADLVAPPLRTIRWQLEELRVSVFGATVRAKGPVSEKRVLAALTEVSG
jgi:ATP-dependent helicase HrpA